MKWSNYNKLYKSEIFGFFLYNSLSNTLIKLDKKKYIFLHDISINFNEDYFKDEKELYSIFIEKKILVEQWDEEKDLNLRKWSRDRRRYNNLSLSLSLTIAPTLNCNFSCPYCFQQNKNSSKISKSTITNLIEFIKSFNNLKQIYINWYGGEPLLAFEKIKLITQKVYGLQIPFNARMITNGYLLDRKMVVQLSELNISNIQITLDGPEPIHDKRRVLIDKTPTFNQILNNVDYLLANWNGICLIRVNIDSSNKDYYPELRKYLLRRYKNKKIKIYSHFVFNSPESNTDFHCQMTIPKWTDYTLELYKNQGILPNEPLYPTNFNFSDCIANSGRGFVIGPDGEIFKCYEDVCNPKRVIGNINNKNGKYITAPELTAMYSIGVDPYDDPKCRDCFCFPICGGGCPFLRLENKYFGKSFNYCSRFKERLIESLELYYDTVMNKAIVDFILTGKGNIAGKHGFMIISDILKSDTENQLHHFIIYNKMQIIIN